MKNELACIVISFRNEPGLIAAVQSLLNQNEALEIVVVNSGGGDPAAALQNAGIQVKVINPPERLYAGGARNLGVEATQAPYVAFLAADCLAEPGWVVGRLREHRAGALAVASAVTNAYPHSYSAWASYMWSYHRRMPGTPAGARILYGLSYDRALFDRFGRFREDLRTGEDTEFNNRLAKVVSIRWAPDVRTAHRHPTGFRLLIRDQYRRGKRLAWYYKQQRGVPSRLTVGIYALLNMLFCIRSSWLAAAPTDRHRMAKAWPLVPPAALAFALGGSLWHETTVEE